MADTKTKVTKLDIPKASDAKDKDDDDNEIDLNIANKLKPETRTRVIRSFKLFLTLFYGQFAANAIYTNLIRGIPQLIENTSHVYPIIRVTLGVIMLLLTAFAIVSISLRKKFSWILIVSSAGVLGLLTVCALVIDIIDIVQRKERKTLIGGEYGSEIAELIVENLLRIIAIIVTVFMSKFIRGFREYFQVPTNEPKA